MLQVRVTPLEIATLRFDLKDAYDLPAEHPAAKAVKLPVLAYHLALPERSVLVDAPAYDAENTPEVYRLPGFEPPPPLLEQLHDAGIDPSAVTDVVITHAHFDHLGALARKAAGDLVPVFPNARHYLGRGEWEPETFGAIARDSLMTVEHAGLLSLVAGDVDLGDGLTLAAAPGESPGHMLARTQVGADVVYVAGDLYHHAFEFAEPGRNVGWVDTVAMQASKEALLARAEREGARVYFSHIRGAHGVHRERGERRWVHLEGP